MKRVVLSCFIAGFVCMIFSCTQRESDIPTPKLNFIDAVEADFESISLSCAVNGNVTVDKLIINYSKDKDLKETKTRPLAKIGDDFQIFLNDLETQTTYYYRYTIENKVSKYTDNTIRQFKTLDYVVPVVTTGDVKNVTGTKATLEGNIDFTCGKEIIEKGFFFGKDNKNLEAKPTTESTLTLAVEGLEFETTYYYQAYAKSEIGTGKGEIKEFKTSNAVSFNALTVQDIMATSVLAKGGIADNDGIEIEKQGFRYSEGISEEYIFVESTGEKTITSLKPATSYKIWYYAKTFEGEFESPKTVFTTCDGTITFGEITTSDISAASISLTSFILEDGGSTIEKRGFVYGTKAFPSLADCYVELPGALGPMTGELINLDNNTTYYIRAYAQNEVGPSYGPQVSITTLSGMALLGQTIIDEILAQSVRLSGEVTSANGGTILDRGFCYSESNNPTINGNKVSVDGAIGLMACTVSSLNNNTEYHVRSFATTNYGTSYSTEKIFKTSDGNITFTALNISDILPESATASVTINSDGGSLVTDCGFCYGTTEQPTISSNKISISSHEYSYYAMLHPLSRSTHYYVRAYATNGTGVYYSSQKELITPSGMATVSSLELSTIESTSAFFSCEVLSDGGATITGRGICYSKDPHPTIQSSKKMVNGTIGVMQISIEDLDPGTMYYVRAFATTSYGTVYSNEVQITTKLGLPTLSPVIVSNIQPTSANLFSGIASSGDGYILEKGYCYSDSELPDKNDIIIYVNTDWTVSITGLNQNTRYYVRSFVTTQYGTSYSDEVSFTTTYYPVLFGDISIINVGITEITVSCSIESYGDNDVIDEGFCFSTFTNPTTSDSRVGYLESAAKVTIKGLTKGTYYYVRKYVSNSVGTFYSDEICAMTYDVPMNAINGVYSVSETKRVVFSKGSIISTREGELSFADSQYYYIGENNAKAIAGSVYSRYWPTDMFFLGNSGVPSYNILGENWSMLTTNEWRYLIEERESASQLISYNITVNGAAGVMLFPDNWLTDSREIPSANSSLSLRSFMNLEALGAVFIPFAGHMYYSNPNGYIVTGVGDSVRVNAYIDNPKYQSYMSYIVFGLNGVRYVDPVSTATSTYGIIRFVSVLSE